VSESGGGQDDGQAETEGMSEQTAEDIHADPPGQVRTIATPWAASHSDTRSQPVGSRRSHAAMALVDHPGEILTGHALDQAGQIHVRAELPEQPGQPGSRRAGRIAALFRGSVDHDRHCASFSWECPNRHRPCHR
jgi:hypothetical protein